MGHKPEAGVAGTPYHSPTTHPPASNQTAEARRAQFFQNCPFNTFPSGLRPEPRIFPPAQHPPAACCNLEGRWQRRNPQSARGNPSSFVEEGKPNRTFARRRLSLLFFALQNLMAGYLNYADQKQRKPFRWWYDAIIDYRLANPTATNGETARHFNVSESYFSIIVNSDMFKAKWEQRRKEHSDRIGTAVGLKMLGTLDLALDVVHEQLENKRGAIPFKDTTAFVSDTLEKLGYGAPKAPGVQVNNFGNTQAVQITQADLNEARQLLRKSEQARVIDAVPVTPTSSPPVGEALPEPVEVIDAA